MDRAALRKRKGEARRRLAEGHSHAEKLMLQHIWHPAFGHFNHLHPEYNWTVVRIGYDDIEQRPRLCQQLLQQMIGRLFGDANVRCELSASERDILRLAFRIGRPQHLTAVKRSAGLRLSCCPSPNRINPQIHPAEGAE